VGYSYYKTNAWLLIICFVSLQLFDEDIFYICVRFITRPSLDVAFSVAPRPSVLIVRPYRASDFSRKESSTNF